MRVGSLVRRALDWDITPAEALRLVRDDAHPVALTGTWAGGADLISSEPVLVRSPPDSLSEVLDRPWRGRAPAAGQDSPSFGGGWLGYLGFGLAGELLPVPPAPGGSRHLPAWWFAYYDHVLRRERASGRWFFEALWTPERATALGLRFAELSRRARAGPRQPRTCSIGEFRLTPSAAGHQAAVGQAIDYIWRGDIFQANICLRLEAGFDGDPLDAFCRAITELDPPYAAFLRLPQGAVASLSPELFLRRDGRSVLSSPIKGTRRRSADRRIAAREREQLERSAKNRAENVMIVDLMRNDLSRVCAAGSVQVPRLATPEPHPGVWHLVSDVKGLLHEGTGDGDLIRAAFPPGSVTGAPKVRALEVIHELEATPREVYTGAAGYRSPVAGLELNVAIRTFEFHDGRVWLGSGGGIVADSRADDEYRECLVKAGPLVRAVGGRLGSQPGGDQAPGPASRPRPAAGIFTSLLVSDGRTRYLDDHLARLDGSARQLFGKGLPDSLGSDLAECLSRRPSGRLRISVRPLGGPLRATVEVVPLDECPPAVDLHPVVIPGGLGGHKWRDRRLLAHGGGPESQMLILDADEQVLETDRASVFAVFGEALCTPPADGRILPGVTRAAVLRLAAAAGIGTGIVPVTWDKLAAASEVFVANAVRGILPARSVTGGASYPAPGPVTRRLAAALAAEPAQPPGPAAALRPAPRRFATAAARRPAGGGMAGTVVVIDNYDSFTYNLVHLLLSAGARAEAVRNDEVTAEQVAAWGPAGVVISPGPCAPADAGISVEVARRCAGAAPVLGICLGHQAIAAAFGAAIIPAPRPVHGQPSVISHDGRGVLAGVPDRFAATRYHSLVVDERSLPSCLSVTARAGEGILMGLRHTALPAEGVQFHPESILTAHGEMIISNFVRSCAAPAARPKDSACRN